MHSSSLSDSVFLSCPFEASVVEAVCVLTEIEALSTILYQISVDYAQALAARFPNIIPFVGRIQKTKLYKFIYICLYLQYLSAQKRAHARRIQNRCSLLVGSSRLSTKFVECPVVDSVPR